MQRGQDGARPSSSGGASLNITWREPSGFVWLSLKNALLTILTLGLYYFWGKVQVRRRIWHAIRINGEPLEYTGTGRELLLGFVIAITILFIGIVAYAVLVFSVFGESVVAKLLEAPLYVMLFWLTGIAVYRARRYRLRRTRWRGIRGTLTGSPVSFAYTWTWTGLLVVLTLGWALPWRQVKLYRRLTNDTRIGTQALRFDDAATAGPLYAPFAMMWFSGFMVALLVFGAAISGIALAMNAGTAKFTDVWVYGAFGLVLALVAAGVILHYHAVKLNYLARHTRLQDGHFRLDLRIGDLFRLVLGNFLILIFSLGILLPVVQKRLARHFVEKLEFVGTVDLDAIAQAGDNLEKTGEGFAEALDIDAF